MAKSNQSWVGVDLDGTLAHYDGWVSPSHIGDPVPRMLERVKGWIAEGRKVKIVTARVSNQAQAQQVREALAPWFVKHGLPLMEVVCCKDYAMVELWDDRAVQVIPNTGTAVVPPPVYMEGQPRPWTVCLTGLFGGKNFDGAYQVMGATKLAACVAAQKEMFGDMDADAELFSQAEFFVVHLFRGHHEDVSD